MKNKIKILFVCHGNICRSPMAEFMLKKMVGELGIEDQFEISSAATSSEEIWGRVGNPVYPPAAAELAAHGISCAGKRAVQIVKSDYDRYDYIICMDKANIRSTSRITGSDSKHKIVMLLDYAGRFGESIADPWYTDNFRLTYNDIDEGLRGFLDYLYNTNQIKAPL